MDIYIASASTPWQDIIPKKYMEVYLAGSGSRPYIHQGTDIVLAGDITGNNRADFQNFSPPGCYDSKVSILESFYYIQPWMEEYIKNSWDFLLDSGAFTFMTTVKDTSIDWDDYVARYCAFISRLGIAKYFELDIDNLVGISKVEEYRSTMEKLTGTKPIPVWHKSRGIDYWYKMCEDYPYIAIGGIVTGEILKSEHSKMIPMIRYAHSKGVKVHGLGFTPLNGELKKYKFDSVDSTAWIYGNRGGFIYRFTGSNLEKIQAPKGSRLKSKEVAYHNFCEWVKFQKYAKFNL